MWVPVGWAILVHWNVIIPSVYFVYFCFVDLDHTADIQLHAWGENLRHAMENIVPCMFNYITDLSLVDIDEHQNVELIVKG
jgi:hypothetical protein